MKSAFSQITIREIIMNKGRYLSILAITGLGVGFFCGLKITHQTMSESIQNYYDSQELYDLHLISAIGITDQEIDRIREFDDVRSAEGTITFDALYDGLNRQQMVLKTHSLPDTINQVYLEYGRMPLAEDECVLDSLMAGEESLGTILTVSPENDKETLPNYRYTEYTVVGIVSTPYYLSSDRGNSVLGTGVIDGYVYLPAQSLQMDYYTDLYVCLDRTSMEYSDDYSNYIENKKTLIEPYFSQLLTERGEQLIQQAVDENDSDFGTWIAEYQEIDKSRLAYDAISGIYSGFVDGIGQAVSNIGQRNDDTDNSTNHITENDPGQTETDPDNNNEKQETYDYLGSDNTNEFWEAYRIYLQLTNPEYYILTRSDNIGCMAFERNAGIIDSVADVFPVFFLLIAMLVCMTTMNRMVEEQRTQIGILKALGYGNTDIMRGYILYAASAAGIGAVPGYFIGIYIIPKVLWIAYGLMYQLHGFIYVWNPILAGIAIGCAILSAILITYLTCQYILKEQASDLMRPKAPKAGERILLERIPQIWNRLKFLQKVSIRNIFRYKKRLFMMLIGISGCTALLLAGFGIHDSVAGFAAKQYQNIELYDASILLNTQSGSSDQLWDSLNEYTSEYQELMETPCDIIRVTNVDASGNSNTYESDQIPSSNITLRIFSDPDTAGHYMQFSTIKGEELTYPKLRQALISDQTAKKFNIQKGDTITLQANNSKKITVIISGIFENHVNNYIILSPDTYRNQTGTMPKYNMILANYKKNDAKNDIQMHQASSKLLKNDEILNISLTIDTIRQVNTIMNSLNYVIILVILCSAILAFIVIYNLTNINITERVREIATIKVLGFFKNETAAYIFRENLIMTLIGSLIGIGLGVMLHQFIMHQIDLNWISFPEQIHIQSYLYSIALTIIFNIIIHIFMGVKLEQIDMVESLKSVD
ncbi:MAG: ABC transporter permease [Lachnospiraceae bacterium]|nr:ABC transporter permease [Lachnospiraceae bacterium]